MNYATAKQFEETTQGTLRQFEMALENIKQAHFVREQKKYKTNIAASSILYEGEQQKLMEDMLFDNVKPYVDQHYWLPLYQMAMYADKIKSTMGYAPTAGNMGRIDDDTMKPTRKSLPCWTVFTEGHVRADGNFAACCFGSDNKFDVGLLDGTNFMHVWNSEKMQKIRQAQLNTLTEGQKALTGTPCSVCVAYE